MIPLLRTVAGLLLISVGMLGLVLPLIPGIPLLLAGVATMGRDHPLLRPVFARLHAWRQRRANSTPTHGGDQL
jgi:uncharacterized membrane protein YbaN (DUF454 family)